MPGGPGLWGNLAQVCESAVRNLALLSKNDFSTLILHNCTRFSARAQVFGFCILQRQVAKSSTSESGPSLS